MSRTVVEPPLEKPITARREQSTLGLSQSHSPAAAASKVRVTRRSVSVYSRGRWAFLVQSQKPREKKLAGKIAA